MTAMLLWSNLLYGEPLAICQFPNEAQKKKAKPAERQAP